MPAHDRTLATPDLLAALERALERVDAEARETKRKIAEKEAVNGASGLQRIHYLAIDALSKVRSHA